MYVEGSPRIDPSKVINYTVSPRLREEASLVMWAVANPPPVFLWTHSHHVVNSTDGTFTSSVEFSSVAVDDFGSYVLTMTNDVGRLDVDYNVVADGNYLILFNVSMFQ